MKIQEENEKNLQIVEVIEIEGQVEILRDGEFLIIKKIDTPHLII